MSLNKVTNKFYLGWEKQELTLSGKMTLFVVEAERGGTNDFEGINDICVDDFTVTSPGCDGNVPLPLPPSSTVPTTSPPSPVRNSVC